MTANQSINQPKVGRVITIHTTRLRLSDMALLGFRGWRLHTMYVEYAVTLRRPVLWCGVTAVTDSNQARVSILCILFDLCCDIVRSCVFSEAREIQRLECSTFTRLNIASSNQLHKVPGRCLAHNQYLLTKFVPSCMALMSSRRHRSNCAQHPRQQRRPSLPLSCRDFAAGRALLLLR